MMNIHNTDPVLDDNFTLMWAVMHIILIFLLGILMVNLMIAVVLHTYEQIQKNSDSYFMVERLRMCYLFMFDWKHMPRIYDKIKHRYFHCENDRVYLVQHVRLDENAK